jgi:hypothetical protein
MHTDRRLRPLTLAVTAIAMAIAIAACGSSSEGTETAPTQEGGGPPASTSTAPAPEAPQGVRAKSCRSVSAVAGGEVRVTGLACASGRRIAAAWSRTKSCFEPAAASRTVCRLSGLICLGAVTDRGIAVNCAAPGRSISFLGKRP